MCARASTKTNITSCFVVFSELRVLFLELPLAHCYCLFVNIQREDGSEEVLFGLLGSLPRSEVGVDGLRTWLRTSSVIPVGPE